MSQFQWHDEPYPSPTTPDGKVILGNMIQDSVKRNYSPIAWLFGKRRLVMPDMRMKFTTRDPVCRGDVFYSPLENIYQSPDAYIHFSLRNADGMQESEWRCKQWKIIPSRWQTFVTHVKWQWKRWITRGYAWKSDQEVASDLKRRGEL